MKKVLKDISIILISVIYLISINSCTNSVNKSHPEVKKRPNIVVIFTDDMNFKDMGVLGGNVLTPTIDSLMTQGVQFTNFYDCSAVCSPSRYNLLTGRYASRSKSLLDQFPTSDPAFLRWNVDINMDERTIAHVMKENGYFTGMVGKYHNLQNEQLQDHIPVDADYMDPEIQKRIRANYNLLRDTVQKTSGFDYLENVYVNNLHALDLPISMQHHNMDWITAGAIDFLDQTNDKPFFLYFATTLPHGPAHVEYLHADDRITPSGLLEKSPNVQPSRTEVIRRVKEAGISEDFATFTWLDDAVGVIIKKLEQKGVLDNTIILFASDHGGNNAKMTCYEKGVRAPAFVYWRNKLQPGKEVNEITANIDFAPTIYELCGITPNASELIDGKSLVPLILGEETPHWRESLLLEITYSKAVVTKDWKFMAVRFPQHILNGYSDKEQHQLNQEGSMFSNNNPDGKMRARYKADEIYPGYFERDQLYNITIDPKEQVNLIDNKEYDAKLQEMKLLLEDYVSEFPHNFGEFNAK